MSALDTLLQKNIQEFTPAEHVIFRIYCEAQIHPDSDVVMLMANLAAEELAAKDAEIARLKESNARLFDDLHNQIHQTVGAEMERDELREQVADVNELLWEFTENPNIELGEKGHNKIEDYFKKYASQEAK